MPLWFVVVCAVMGAVLTYWLVREVIQDQLMKKELRRISQSLRRIDQQERDRKIFEAIARGRR